MPFGRPIRFRRRQVLRAADLNALARAAQRVTEVTADASIGVRRSAGSVSLSAARGRAVWMPATITAAPPAGVPIEASLALYSARVLDEPGILIESVRPHYTSAGVQVGQSPAPRILPARVGDDCFVVIRPTPSSQGDPATPRVRLAVVSEAIAWCAPDQQDLDL